MSFRVASFSVPSTAAEGVFSGTGVPSGSYTLHIQVPSGLADISLVDSIFASATGFVVGDGSLNTEGTVVNTDGSEVYLYNSGSSDATVWVVFSPLSVTAGPASASTSFTY